MLTIETDRPRTRSGFADVYAAHRDEVLRFAVLLCGDRDLAEDVVADAFARTLPRWESGDVRDPGPYLRRAVANGLASSWRRRALRRSREERRLTGDHRGERGADETLADRDAVMEAVRSLPLGQREVVVLRFYEDLDTAEIARVLDVAESTVRTRLHRAGQALQARLGTEEGTR